MGTGGARLFDEHEPVRGFLNEQIQVAVPVDVDELRPRDVESAQERQFVGPPGGIPDCERGYLPYERGWKGPGGRRRGGGCGLPAGGGAAAHGRQQEGGREKGGLHGVERVPIPEAFRPTSITFTIFRSAVLSTTTVPRGADSPVS